MRKTDITVKIESIERFRKNKDFWVESNEENIIEEYSS